MHLHRQSLNGRSINEGTCQCHRGGVGTHVVLTETDATYVSILPTLLRGPNADCICRVTLSTSWGKIRGHTLLMGMHKHIREILSMFTTSPRTMSNTFPSHDTF